jgi:hypothetical protein
MCELVVNDWLRQQFPAESLVERASNWTYRIRVETGWKLAKYGRAIGQRLNDLRTISPSAPRES